MSPQDRNAEVIIGAHFGDEGKGRLTDRLAAIAPAETLVIRYNGGAQAGHTVMDDAGRRHVFSHVGSGALAGASTWLGPGFVASPPLFLAERDRLADLGLAARVAIHPDALVTTPFDVLVNQAVEIARGGERHGSCGIGFGETVGRDEDHPEMSLRAADLCKPDRMMPRLQAIRDQWVPSRLTALGVSHLPEPLAELLRDDSVLEVWLEEARAMAAAITVADETLLTATDWRHLLFEGAQGLLLDADFGWFPHVTRSRTGLAQVMPLAVAARLTRLRVHYLTRSYLTRHGAGPLPGELPAPPSPRIVDPTNAPNSFQGSLRFAPLRPALTATVIRRDLDSAAPAGLTLDPGLAVTCLDQVDGTMLVNTQAGVRALGPGALCQALETQTGLPVRSTGWGPARAELDLSTLGLRALHPCAVAP